MSMRVLAIGGWTTGILLGVLLPAAAQSPPVGQPAPSSVQAPRAAPDRQQRYRIATMERVLEGAVEHGAAITRERLQAYLPADMLLNENARVRGFRLDGYGVFFDVSVPSLEGTLPWSFRVLDQNNLGLENAVSTLRSFIESSSPNDVDVQQAFRRLVMQAAPGSPLLSGGRDGLASGPNGPVIASSPAPQNALQSAVSVAQGPVERTPPQAARPAADSILDNPLEAYRLEVRDALMDAMLDHSRSLNLTAEEWLTVAARGHDERPRLAPMDNDAQTVVIRVRGADLNAYLGGQTSREDARRRMDVRVF